MMHGHLNVKGPNYLQVSWFRLWMSIDIIFATPTEKFRIK